MSGETVTRKGDLRGDGGAYSMSDGGDGISRGQPLASPVSSASTRSSSSTFTHEASVGSVDITKQRGSLDPTLGRTRPQTRILQQPQQQSVPDLPQGDHDVDVYGTFVGHASGTCSSVGHGQPTTIREDRIGDDSVHEA